MGRLSCNVRQDCTEHERRQTAFTLRSQHHERTTNCREMHMLNRGNCGCFALAINILTHSLRDDGLSTICRQNESEHQLGICFRPNRSLGTLKNCMLCLSRETYILHVILGAINLVFCLRVSSPNALLRMSSFSFSITQRARACVKVRAHKNKKVLSNRLRRGNPKP